MARVVTLTTDFGPDSGYVAELKGRLLHARAALTLVDISHAVPAHDVSAAAWLVAQACPAFPAGTLHVVVVDPGVGTRRRLVWAELGGDDRRQEVLCPDNGVLTAMLRRLPLRAAREIVVPAGASATFHGRDVLAPAAVRLLEGDVPASLGEPVARLALLPWAAPEETAAGLRGAVAHVDAFGNLVTNLPAEVLPRIVAAGGLRVGETLVGTVVRTYGDAPPGTVVALVGSQGLVEAAVVEGRADTRLHARRGTPVTVAPATRRPDAAQ
ncbi:MAG: hypothetical protein EBX36_02715 [Planctomycetia bacterium]|nr:hypothetical protein [Planctomycetia bacterium]